MHLLKKTIESILPLNSKAMESAAQRQNELTKPKGSLGRLEELSITIAGIMAKSNPEIKSGAIFVMAGDHGVCEEGISLFPQEVTSQMILNFLHGGAGINVLATRAASRVIVTDCGIKNPIPQRNNFYLKSIRNGTSNIAKEKAMSYEEAIQSIEIGIEVFETEYLKAPFDICATGDMGIGNTTSSAAITSVFSELPVNEVTGKGTGISDDALNHKIAVIEKAIALHKPNIKDALDVLSKVGGFEIGAIAGICLAASAHKIPVVIDGFISGAGALIAANIAPLCKDYMIAGHTSVEKGHMAILKLLNKKPLLNLDLRLGEGTGAALAIQLCEAACGILNEMATFEEAGVANAKNQKEQII